MERDRKRVELLESSRTGLQTYIPDVPPEASTTLKQTERKINSIIMTNFNALKHDATVVSSEITIERLKALLLAFHEDKIGDYDVYVKLSPGTKLKEIAGFQNSVIVVRARSSAPVENVEDRK